MAEQKWFEGLRHQIKHRCGPGWGIDERHGAVRLTRRIAAGKQHKNPRQTVQLGIPWNPAHSGDIFLVVRQDLQLKPCDSCRQTPLIPYIAPKILTSWCVSARPEGVMPPSGFLINPRETSPLRLG